MLSGQMDLGSANENVALAATTDVASFTDSNLSDTASSFTVNIDWGDGTTTPGTVGGSNGHFTVEGGHTYADEGSPTAIVIVTRTADSSTLTMLGTVSVADTDTINPHATTITFTPNQPLTNVTVATFTGPTNPSNLPGDFVAQIDWGDGTTTAGTVQESGGTFSVVGSHTYTAAGEFSISVSMADDFPDAATGFVTSTAVSGFGAQVTLNSATEGTLINGEVATFADTSGSHFAGDYTATIVWGDGSTTSGTVSGSGQTFTVTGSHTYADEEGLPGASPVMLVDITRTADSATANASGTVVVADADFLTPHSQTVGGSANEALSNVKVATFSDSYTGQVAGDLTAMIDWGDGSTTDAGTVSGGSGAFTVMGSHTYTTNGQFDVAVDILDDIPQSAVIGAIASEANIGLAPGTFLLNNVTEGDGTSHNVATFGDGNTSDTAADFTATVDWGDGSTTGGTISDGSGSFTVSGIHAYADEGDETPTVTLTRTADHETATVTGGTTVGEGDALAVTHSNFSHEPGQAFNGLVATFTTTFTGNVAGDFTATIDWGDGTSSAGTISGSNGSFAVDGSHTYDSGGTFFVKTTVSDDAPGIASANDTGQAMINLAGAMVLNTTSEGVALNNVPVATFSDGDAGDQASDFAATINWGDGTTTAGTVSGGTSPGTFTVLGSHTYADEGLDHASVTLSNTHLGATSTTSGNVSVVEGDSLTGHPTSFTANAHQVFSGAVATFDDPGYPANVAGDFVATIDWGDGVTTAGTVSGGSGSAFTVSGSHAYAASGQDTVTVTLADDAPGTASATVTSSATVNPGAAVPYDFDADGLSDLLFQNRTFSADPTNGTPQIWLWNGTAITTKATLQTPTAGWLVVGSGDFNDDGHADIAWQNTDGTPAIWLINGTTIIGSAILQKPTAGWQIVATGDFNNDGHSDLLWQNTDGAPAIWEMNGTTIIGSAILQKPTAGWNIIATGDFNGDGHADILWQNTDGAPAIWEMNGTTIIGSAILQKPTAGWHAVATGDVNGDGHADILWQNTDGAPAIWEMNGTTIIGSAVLPNPGSAWKLIGSGDFTNDGLSDLLFQNADGTPMIWEMNGTSVVAQLTLSNPGATWRLDPTNPLAPSAQNSASTAAGPTMHQSSPDTANTGAPDFRNGLAALSLPTGATSQFAGWSSLLNNSAVPTFLSHLLPGTG